MQPPVQFGARPPGATRIRREKDWRSMSTVLVVEDSPVAREVVMKILEREGYDVVGACNGLEALDCVHAQTPDLMLLDVMMPEMDGMALLQELRGEPRYRELPVILLTALSDEGRMKRAQELGVCEYLVKTRFSYDELVDQVGKHVVRH
jgi:CheY-like chemotaxis protein